MIQPLHLPSLTFRPLRQSYGSQGEWWGHMAFACDLVAALQPKVFVELGTHFGESYFAFCQAIQEQKIPCQAIAVDIWRGDQQMGPYDEDVFEDVEAFNRSHYTSFSTLLRMSFDEAVSRFRDESIDLLHMDGLATYDAVRHDFETWLPKLKPGAIVVVHYATERHEIFDIRRCWLELGQRYQTFEFRERGGLGVLRIPGPARECGVLEILYGKDTAQQERLGAYYDLCASRLAQDRQKAGEWETRTQVFWRTAQEYFSELRSAQRWHTLRTTASTIRIKLPPMEAAEELRLDIADRRMSLWVHRVSLFDASGRRFWFRKGNKLFEDSTVTGMRVFLRDERAFVIMNDKDCALQWPLDDALRAELASGAVMELELQGVETDACIETLADPAQLGYSQMTTTQVFWRATNEDFCESRSAERWHILQTTSSIVRIKLPPMEAPEELRLDIAERRTSLWVHQVSLFDLSGRRFWYRKGNKLFEDVKLWGMHVFPSGGRALVIVHKRDSALQMTLDDALRAELERGAVMELELQGIETNACIDVLADRARLGISQVKMLRSRLRKVQSPSGNGTPAETENSDGNQETQPDAQRLIAERDDEIYRLRAALALAVRQNLETR